MRKSMNYRREKNGKYVLDKNTESIDLTRNIRSKQVPLS